MVINSGIGERACVQGTLLAASYPLIPSEAQVVTVVEGALGHGSTV